MKPQPQRAERLRPQDRIRGRRAFDSVFAARHVASGTTMVVHACENEWGHSRLGISIGRRIGSAPERNRRKRLVREAFRRNRERLPEGLDLVVVIRGTDSTAYATVVEELVRCATDAGRRCRRASRQRNPEGH